MARHGFVILGWGMAQVECAHRHAGGHRGSARIAGTVRTGEYNGLELRTSAWKVHPLAVEQVGFLQGPNLLPAGSAEFDCALLMRDTEHEWHGREPLCLECCGSAKVPAQPFTP